MSSTTPPGVFYAWLPRGKGSNDAQMQQVMFFQSVAIMGGALLITRLGAGPASLDARSGG